MVSGSRQFRLFGLRLYADVVENLLEKGHDPDECAELYFMGRDVVFLKVTSCSLGAAAIAGGDTTTVKRLLRSCKHNIGSPCCGPAIAQRFGTLAERE